MALLLVVIYITFISLGLPDSLFGVAWPAAHLEFSVNEGFGAIYSIIIGVTTGGISFFAGGLIRKFGIGIVTAVSVLMTAISLIGISFAPDIWVMMVFAIIGGFGAGAIDTGLNNFVSLKYKAIHMNWLHCFWGVGVTASPLIMSYFLKNATWREGYRTVSYIQFAITIIVFLSLFLWKKYDFKREKQVPEIKQKKPKTSIIKILKQKGVIFGILSLGFYCSMESLVGTWGASYTVNVRNLTPDVAAKYVSAYFGGIMAGRFISGIVSLKVSDKNLIRGGIAVSALGIIMLFIPNNITSLIGLLLIGIGFGPIFPSTLHAIPDRFGDEHSADITGFHMGGAYAIGFAVQLAFGFTASATTFKITPFVMIALCALLCLFAEFTVKKTAKKDFAPASTETSATSEKIDGDNAEN